MRGQKDYFGSVLMGLGGAEPVTVRETRWGFVIQSANPGGSWRYFVERALRFGTVAVWLAVIGLWLMPLSPWPQFAFALKSFASVALLGLTYTAVVLTRRKGAYVVHVDCNRRELRTATVTAQGHSRIKSSHRFDEIGEAVLERGRTETAVCSLVLRLKDKAEVIPVAVGDDPTLLAVYDRLMRDLCPMEERMAADGLSRIPPRPLRGRKAFPMLGPEETAARGRRAISV